MLGVVMTVHAIKHLVRHAEKAGRLWSEKVWHMSRDYLNDLNQRQRQAVTYGRPCSLRFRSEAVREQGGERRLVDKLCYGAVSNSGPNVESNRSSITAFSSLSLVSSAVSRARAVSWAGRVVAGSFAEGSAKAF